MTHFCPNCGYEFGLDEAFDTICKECGFDFNDTLKCCNLFKGKCLITNKLCTVRGLDYEDCSYYLQSIGFV